MTRLEEVYRAFFEKIEEDREFFDYHGLHEAEGMALAKERANTYLAQALSLFWLRCEPDFDPYDVDEVEKAFRTTLAPLEIDLLASLMLQFYLKGRMARLKAFELNFVPSDLKIFSPAEDRRSFLDMYKTVCLENEVMLDNYSAKGRDGSRLQIDYSRFEENLFEGG